MLLWNVEQEKEKIKDKTIENSKDDGEEQARKFLLCKSQNVTFYKIREVHFIYIWIRMNYVKALGNIY